MPDTPSITIIKRFTYRGKDEEWSNTYHFSGTTPANPEAWKTLADAIIASERHCVATSVKYVRAYGYEAGNEHSVATIDYVALGGTLVTGDLGTSNMAGDQALWLRCATPDRTSKGKPIYLRKYFHGGINSGNPDTPDVIWKNALTAHGAKMIDGSLPGGAKWCGPQGAVASNPQAGNFITTRTLKRRGKRP